MQLLPMDGIDKADQLLNELETQKLIIRSTTVIQIADWSEPCHKREQQSKLLPIENNRLIGNPPCLGAPLPDKAQPLPDKAQPLPVIIVSASASASASPPIGAPPSRKALGARLPDDFTLTDELRAFAVAEGVPPERTFATFVDYWRAQPGAKGRKTDWIGTWRNWCRREHDRTKTRPTAYRPTTPGRVIPDVDETRRFLDQQTKGRA